MTFGITIKPAKAFGNRPDPGRSQRYAREDHDHGTPDMTTEAVTPVIPYATTVVEQKDFGLPSQVGTDQRLARADHQHGTPDFDPADKQDLLVSGLNIKTINTQSILGAGDITIIGTGGGGYSYFPSGW
jgi:hypothetical protein